MQRGDCVASQRLHDYYIVATTQLGVGREVVRIATQSYYVVSSSRLFLVHQGKQISKTASTQQAEANQRLYHDNDCTIPSSLSVAFPLPCTKHPPRTSPKPSCHHGSARRRSERPQHQDQRHLRAYSPRNSFDSQLSILPHSYIPQKRRQPRDLRSKPQPRAQTARILAARHRQHRQFHKFATKHDRASTIDFLNAIHSRGGRHKNTSTLPGLIPRPRWRFHKTTTQVAIFRAHQDTTSPRQNHARGRLQWVFRDCMHGEKGGAAHQARYKGAGFRYQVANIDRSSNMAKRGWKTWAFELLIILFWQNHRKMVTDRRDSRLELEKGLFKKD